MKRQVSKIGLLLSLLSVFYLNPLNAQVTFSVTHVSFRHPNVTLGFNDTLNITVKNTGTQTFNGKLYIDYQSDTMLQREVLDSVTLTNFIVNDSTKFASTIVIQKPKFHAFTNIVVVWPRAAGAANDSAQATVNANINTGLKREQAIQNDLVLYPNPTNNTIYLQLGGLKFDIDHVRIYDAHGILIKDIKSNNRQVDIAELNNGLYFLEVETINGTLIRKQFIRQ